MVQNAGSFLKNGLKRERARLQNAANCMLLGGNPRWKGTASEVCFVKHSVEF